MSNIDVERNQQELERLRSGYKMVDPVRRMKEIRNRIRLSIYAYAYEFKNESLISDGEFDKMALEIEPDIMTSNEKLDKFFFEEFDSSTGQWIHKHPELEKVAKLYDKYYATQT